MHQQIRTRHFLLANKNVTAASFWLCDLTSAALTLTPLYNKVLIPSSFGGD
jgi:hypothetical protein